MQVAVVVQTTMDAMRSRSTACVAVGGGHFEYRSLKINHKNEYIVHSSSCPGALLKELTIVR